MVGAWGAAAARARRQRKPRLASSRLACAAFGSRRERAALWRGTVHKTAACRAARSSGAVSLSCPCSQGGQPAAWKPPQRDAAANTGRHYGRDFSLFPSAPLPGPPCAVVALSESCCQGWKVPRLVLQDVT